MKTYEGLMVLVVSLFVSILLMYAYRTSVENDRIELRKQLFRAKVELRP